VALLAVTVLLCGPSAVAELADGTDRFHVFSTVLGCVWPRVVV
jgi:hypothetical protein